MRSEASLSWNWWRQHQKPVSMLDCMDFSSVNWFLCIESGNQLLSILFGCRTEKIWGKETLNPKSTDTWKSKSGEDKSVFMNYNPNSGGMKQSRHNIFEQNAPLIKLSVKKCLPSGLPFQQGVTVDSNIDERGRECLFYSKLHSMVNKNNLQHVGRVSLGQ